ncbi:hypothetical protein DYI25_13100 [Mesobacillus boroniphilus]|uniref:Uncharacterized protein n=1 Tax=Mesobacillus boroniphilus TaxID=308892 RepID=A0A944CMC8_9BACI|nr:hypothetical protein [Mesobacillus boroniphilus]
MAQRFLIHYPQYTITVEINCPQVLELCKSCQEGLWIIKIMSIFVHRALDDAKMTNKIYRLTFLFMVENILLKIFLGSIDIFSLNFKNAFLIS